MPPQSTYKNSEFRASKSPENTVIFQPLSSGKEKDSETGYYFGARYYNPDLSLWLSVDPMSDKYPSLSPYNYCAWNPLRLVDPTGMELDEPSKWKNISPVIPREKFVGWQRNPYRTIMTERRMREGRKIIKPNCNDHAKMQLEQVGCYTTGANDHRNMIPYTERDGVVQDQTNKAVEYIHEQLEHGLPVFIGVDSGVSQKINNKTTDHYLVIVGQGNDEIGNFFQVYDNATSSLEYGTSSNNKLYQQEDGKLSGAITLMTHIVNYTISEVRPTFKKSKKK